MNTNSQIIIDENKNLFQFALQTINKFLLLSQKQDAPLEYLAFGETIKN